MDDSSFSNYFFKSNRSFFFLLPRFGFLHLPFVGQFGAHLFGEFPRVPTIFDCVHEVFKVELSDLGIRKNLSQFLISIFEFLFDSQFSLLLSQVSRVGLLLGRDFRQWIGSDQAALGFDRVAKLGQDLGFLIFHQLRWRVQRMIGLLFVELLEALSEFSVTHWCCGVCGFFVFCIL